jgi:hypothetical protein
VLTQGRGSVFVIADWDGDFVAAEIAVEAAVGAEERNLGARNHSPFEARDPQKSWEYFHCRRPASEEFYYSHSLLDSACTSVLEDRKVIHFLYATKPRDVICRPCYSPQMCSGK